MRKLLPALMIMVTKSLSVFGETGLGHTCSPSEYQVEGRCCSMCNPGAGLNMKRKCSSTSDTLCEPLEGHYCTDPIQDGCRGAVEHTKCKPGQSIKQKGTVSSDTVCGNCSRSTYSDGSFTSCKPHTVCELLGLGVVSGGTPSHDTVCGEGQSKTAVIAGIIAAVIIFTVGFGCVYVCCDRYNIRLCKIPRIFMW